MYCKIFAQIFDSSIAEDWQVRHVFTDLLTLADMNGVVDMTPEAISRRTNTPLEIVTRAITQLESPDPKSRSAEAQGRRIARLDEHRTWGWVIVNYPRYRALASEEQRRAKTAARARRFRSKQKQKKESVPSDKPQRRVTHRNAGNAMQSQSQSQKQREMQETGQDSARSATRHDSGELVEAKPQCRDEVVEYFETLNPALTKERAVLRADRFLSYNESVGWRTRNWRGAAKRFNEGLRPDE